MSKFSLLVFLGLGIISSACTFSIQALSKSYEVTQTFIQPLPSKEANLTLTLLPRPSPSQTAFLSPFPSITPSKVASPILPPSLSSLRIAFTNNKKLWFWQNGKAEPLTDLEGYARVNISDDGKIIAFARDKGLWAINTDGSNEHILVTANDFKLMEPKDPGVALNQLDWIPETHKLLFNTIVLASYGLSYADDLYRVNADTMQLAMLRKPGKGGRFIISPDGKRVALVTPSQISVMKVDGSNNRMLLGYSVPSGSEAAYYTQPVWASDSQSLTVAIPPYDFFYGTTLPTNIWRLPIDGSPPEIVSQLPASNDRNDLRFWSPDRKHYAFQSGNKYHLGLDGTDLGPLTEPSSTFGWFSWIDETHFLYLGSCDLRLGTIGAPSALITNLRETGNCVSSYDFIK